MDGHWRNSTQAILQRNSVEMKGSGQQALHVTCVEEVLLWHVESGMHGVVAR